MKKVFFFLNSIVMVSSLCRSIIKFDVRKYELDGTFMKLKRDDGLIVLLLWDSFTITRLTGWKKSRKFLLRDTTESLITQHESTGFHNTEINQSTSARRWWSSSIIIIGGAPFLNANVSLMSSLFPQTRIENENMWRRWNIILDFLACHTRRANVDHFKTKFIIEGRESFAAGVSIFFWSSGFLQTHCKTYTQI